MLDWVSGPAFDQLLVDTVRSTYPAHEQEQFIAHFRGLVGLWVNDETSRLGPRTPAAASASCTLRVRPARRSSSHSCGLSRPRAGARNSSSSSASGPRIGMPACSRIASAVPSSLAARPASPRWLKMPASSSTISMVSSMSPSPTMSAAWLRSEA